MQKHQMQFITKPEANKIDCFSSGTFVLFTINKNGKIIYNSDGSYEFNSVIKESLELISKHQKQIDSRGELSISKLNCLISSGLWVNINKLEVFMSEVDFRSEEGVIKYQINPKLFSFNLEDVKGILNERFK